MKAAKAAAVVVALCLAPVAAWAVPGISIVVIDGDTVRTAQGETIRVLQVDTPEISRPRCENELKLGLAAKKRLQDILHGAPDVEFVRYGKDRFNRTLAKIMANGRDVGVQLILEGYGLAYTPGWQAKAYRIAVWCK
jgi:endonuclease YncB( thermonuclease family)